jgi:Rrf2 family transcriptional regulator, cysteine metabolism repressor
MKYSTKERYGLRLLLDIATHQEQEPVSMKDIASRQQIPFSYAKHVASYLIAGGLLRSARGANGGLSLNKSPGQIKLKEIIQLYDGPVTLVECVSNPSVCKKFQSCAIRDTWVEMQKSVDKVLETTVGELMERQKEKAQLVAIA